MLVNYRDHTVMWCGCYGNNGSHGSGGMLFIPQLSLLVDKHYGVTQSTVHVYILKCVYEIHMCKCVFQLI